MTVTTDVMETPAARAIVAEYRAAGHSKVDTERFAKALISSGTQLPVAATVSPGFELIKVVPKTASGGDMVSATTPFFITKKEFQALSSLSANQMAQRLGLPAEQAIRGAQIGFDVYVITPKPGNLATVFVSETAPIQQAGYAASGGAQQVLVPNRHLWTDPVMIGSLKGSK